MPYAIDGLISTSPLDGGISITSAQYTSALQSMLDGDSVAVVDNELTIVAAKDITEPTEPEPPAPVPVAARIANKRYTHEVSGATVNGVPVATDRDSQGLLLGAALAAFMDPEYTVRFKTATGEFVTLSADQTITVANAIRKHVQDCFDRESELLLALEQGTFTDNMLDEGWPTY